MKENTKWKPLTMGSLAAKYPIVQGGMGVGVSLSGLAGAVAKEGGIGVISAAQIGYRESDYDAHPLEANLRAVGTEIQRAREIADGGIIGINIMVVTQQYEQYVRAAVEAGVDLIVSGAGLPTSLPEWVKDTNTKIAPIVSSLKAASVICKLWDRKYKRLPDMVVIEGPKAGGHLGFSVDQIETFDDVSFGEEVKKIVAYVKEFGQKQNTEIPVIFGGGIYDRADMERAMELGVDGVQIATRFVTTKECDASDQYKEAYIQCKKEDIQIVNSPVGMPGRALENAFIKKTKERRIPAKKCHLCIATCTPSETPYCIADALLNAVNGNISDALVFCGEGAYRSEKIESVAEIFGELTEK